MTAARAPGDDFTRLKFVWLEQVARDSGLPPFATRVAAVLLRYFNRERGCAYPSIARLALDLDASERSIQRALRDMTPRHLTVVIGGGRSTTNQYQWNIGSVDADKLPHSRRDLPQPKTPSELSPIKPTKPRQDRQGIEALNPDNPGKKTPSELSPDSFEGNPLKESSSSTVPLEPPATDDDEILIRNLEKTFGTKAPASGVRSALPMIRSLIAEGIDLDRAIMPELAEIAAKLKDPLFTFSTPFIARQIRSRNGGLSWRPEQRAGPDTAPARTAGRARRTLDEPVSISPEKRAELSKTLRNIAAAIGPPAATEPFEGFEAPEKLRAARRA
jgi:hypothetical protein